MSDTPQLKSSNSVTVGCKLPNGLICELGKVGDDNYKAVRLNGANSSAIVGGYGLTNVPADFWNAWAKLNQRMTFMQKGLVFAERDKASANDQAETFAEKKTGMERLNPAEVSKIAPGVEADMNHLKQGIRDGMQRARVG